AAMEAARAGGDGLDGGVVALEQPARHLGDRKQARGIGRARIGCRADEAFEADDPTSAEIDDRLISGSEGGSLDDVGDRGGLAGEGGAIERRTRLALTEDADVRPAVARRVV